MVSYCFAITNGVRGGSRTPGLFLRREALCLLSYTDVKWRMTEGLHPKLRSYLALIDFESSPARLSG